MKREPRVSLSASDASHVYEWLRMYWLGDKYAFGGCFVCAGLGRRLERLIGEAEVRRIVRAVKKSPVPHRPLVNRLTAKQRRRQ